MKTNNEKVEELGWLDEDGVCVLPDDVLACTTGFLSPGLPITFFAKATPEQIQQAIDKGWIKFIDGNGGPEGTFTFAAYVAKYPEYPDPVFQLELRGKWPPKAENIFKIGGN